MSLYQPTSRVRACPYQLPSTVTPPTHPAPPTLTRHSFAAPLTPETASAGTCLCSISKHSCDTACQASQQSRDLPHSLTHSLNNVTLSERQWACECRNGTTHTHTHLIKLLQCILQFALQSLCQYSDGVLLVEKMEVRCKFQRLLYVFETTHSHSGHGGDYQWENL